MHEPLGDYGFVFQTPSLMPWRSVLGNVLFPMEILGRNDKAARARALELVGLSGFLHARPHQLSGGMQQRVALCRALIHEPKLLLMDEPFGALDELTRLEMNDLLLRIRRTGASVLFVTHSISEAVYLSDKVIVFSRRPARVITEIADHARAAQPEGALHPRLHHAERDRERSAGRRPTGDGRGGGAMTRRLVTQLGYPLLGIVLIVAAWALLCWALNVPTAVLPTPDRVWRALWRGRTSSSARDG